MNAGRLRTGWLCGLAAATLAAPLVRAQDAPTSSPSPVVVPSQRPQTLPGVIPERFNLAPSPTPTATPLPPPTPIPTARATPAAQRPVPAARSVQTPRGAASVVATPTPSASPTAAPVATPAPAPVTTAPQPVATAAPAGEPASSVPPWLWAAAGAGGTALLGLGGWLLLRRRRREEDAEERFESVPVETAPPPPPVQPPPGLKPAAAPAPEPVRSVLQAGEPFELALQPHRIAFGEDDVLLEFELLIGNLSGASADNIRVAFAAMSAHAQQDAVIAGFHGGPPGEPGGAPFDLPAGGGGRMPVRLAIPRSGVNVVEVSGRPMFVPIVLIDLRWRGGLSIRRFGADFMLGTAGQGDKLGPIWLDRPAPSGALAAHRYHAKAAVAA